MVKVYKIIKTNLQNCELSGNILNRNIQKTKDLLDFNNSPTQQKQKQKEKQKNDNQKLILKINYSKVKDLRDVERQIFNNSKQENIKNNKSVSIFKLKQKNNQSQSNDNKNTKNKIPTKLLLLPICSSYNKSYIKTSETNANNVLI